MEPIHLYFATLGASIALSLVGILIVLRDAAILPVLRWSCVGLFVAGAAHSIFFGPVGKGLLDGWGPLLVFLSAAGVALLWSIVRLLFDDRFNPADAYRWPPALIALGIALPIAVAWLLPQYKGAAMLLVAALSATLVLHMLWILVLGRADDLDSYRRWLRALLAGGCSIYVALVLAAHFLGLLQGRPIAGAIWLACGQVAVKLVWLLLVLGAPSPMTRLYRITHASSRSPLVPLSVVDAPHVDESLEARATDAAGTIDRSPSNDAAAPRLLTDSPATEMPTVSEAVVARQATAILEAMEREKLYRQQGLSIGKLADHLRLPEHRVRSLINGHLQFRNYTAFLNHFRLAEVAHRLRDPGQAHLPILSIALDVGYASIAPFNRAFRDAFGQTPSEYRQGASPGRSEPKEGP
jgi:AraC-like DNA-binding protein